MKRLATLTFIILICASCTFIDDFIDVPRPEAQREPAIPAETEVEEYHYTGKFCADCHEPIPTEGGDPFLKHGGDFNKSCKCHVTAPGSYIHPVDMAPSQEKRTKIPDDLPLTAGKVTCLTCHDIYRQCRKRTVDKRSLRGVPYARRSDFCLKCHDETSYVMFDPHNLQLNENGDVDNDKCLYCHTEKPDEKQESVEDRKLIGDPEDICQGCHAISGNHSGNFNHLVTPSAETLARMKQMEIEFNIILPLDAEGKMTCATCHNPHDKGIISADRPSARGAGSKFRHRLPGGMCQECHQI